MTVAAPLPNTEASRLRMLQSLDVLDSRPEAFSDAVAFAAATIANTPMGAISLVDKDRQWLKGAVGFAATEAAREISFCAHAILETGPLIVADARLDPRFASNPMVTGDPHVRFYAGFPLVVNDHALGSLCVIDDRPRSLTEQQIAELTRLAQGVAVWLGEYVAG